MRYAERTKMRYAPQEVPLGCDAVDRTFCDAIILHFFLSPEHSVLSFFLAANFIIWLIVHPMNTLNNQEIRYRLFKILDDKPHRTQRQMAGKMDISLGKFNYCLAELVKKGFVKMDRFKSSANKAAYMYILTPRGLEEKAKVTIRFLHRKMEEFEEIKKQIEELAGEVENLGPNTNRICKKSGSK